MTLFNPLGTSLQAATAQQRLAVADKDRQIAKAQATQKNVAADSDRFEHQVESADALGAVHDQQHEQGRNGKYRGQQANAQGEGDAEGEAPHLDVTA
jgi:hypothetical protein